MLYIPLKLKGFFSRHHRVLFYSTWAILALVQAYYTELMDDEAYYWLYSSHLAFGYYEHPPMIAIMIRAGYLIFQNELGVRLFAVVLNIATIYLVQQLLHRKNDLLFYAIVISISITQLGGFIAAPDSPMICCIVIFFHAYQSFIRKMDWANTLLLGLVAALLLYSKYHGIFVLLFTLLSNPKLFTKRKAWLAGLITFLLLIPHFYWQWINDFPSLRLHLSERLASNYKVSYTFNYVSGQILTAGPLAGWLLLWAAFRYKPVSLTERALKFTLCGIYLFFLAFSFKSYVEANWTIAAFVGLIVLSHQYLATNRVLRRWLYLSVPFSLLLVFANRAFLVLDNQFTRKMTKSEFHGNKTSAQILQRRIDNLPLVILNSYQKSSKYSFYTMQHSFSLNTANYHRNSFNYWDVEDSLIGHPAFVIGEKDSLLNEPLGLPQYPNVYGKRVNNYYSFSRVLFNNIQNVAWRNGNLQLNCSIKTPSNYLTAFQYTPFDTAGIYIALYKEDNEVSSYHKCDLTLKGIDRAVMTRRIYCSAFPPGKYTARIVISSCLPGLFTINSNKFLITQPVGYRR
ncbi:MAG: glycosyltransferase family 39 protein [Ferruginibacter sp.]